MEITPRQLEIIEAAGKILTSSGVSGLTIKNLAKEMQFSESAIYRHFTSKEEIIVAMLNYLAETIDKRLQNAIQTIEDPEEKFTAIFQSQFTFFENHRHFVVAVFSDGLLKESQVINEAILKVISVKIKYLFPILLEGQQKGVFTNTISTEDLMYILMGTFRLLMFRWRLEDFQFDIKTSGNKMIQSVLTLIKNK
ncbi:MAG TPA: TetR/AcrR family transcriptional regulator [Prolixibacteraceae bacterium]|nr:TetR/AcrR family transcriptional regulator [Prolixibacteraceae bacterium]